jgi:hypothetical protein
MDFGPFIQQRIDRLAGGSPKAETKVGGQPEPKGAPPSNAQTLSSSSVAPSEPAKALADRDVRDLTGTLTFLRDNAGESEHDFIMLQLLIGEKGDLTELAQKLHAVIANTTGDHAALLEFIGHELLRQGLSKDQVVQFLANRAPAASGPAAGAGSDDRTTWLLGGMSDDENARQTQRQKVRDARPKDNKALKRERPQPAPNLPPGLSAPHKPSGPKNLLIDTKHKSPSKVDSEQGGGPPYYMYQPDSSIFAQPVAPKAALMPTPDTALQPAPIWHRASSTEFGASSSSSSSLDLSLRPVRRDDSSPVGQSGLYTPPELEDEDARDFEQLQAQAEAEDQPALEPNPPESKASVRRAPSQSFNADELPLKLSEADPDQLARQAANDPAKRKSYARTVWEGVMNGTITDEWSRKFMATLITGLKQHNARVLPSAKAILIASVTVTASQLIRKAKKAKNVAHAHQIEAASTSIRAELNRLTPEIKPQPLRPSARAKRRNGLPPTT